MRKMTKRLFFRIITAFLFLLLITGRCFADFTDGYFEYLVENEGIVITGYFGNETEVTIPDHIAGYPVWKIQAGAFVGTGVQIIHLPNTVSEVADGAFEPEQYVEWNNPVDITPSPAQTTEAEPAQQPNDAVPETEGSQSAYLMNQAGEHEASSQTVESAIEAEDIQQELTQMPVDNQPEVYSNLEITSDVNSETEESEENLTENPIEEQRQPTPEVEKTEEQSVESCDNHEQSENIQTVDIESEAAQMPESSEVSKTVNPMLIGTLMLVIIVSSAWIIIRKMK